MAKVPSKYPGILIEYDSSDQPQASLVTFVEEVLTTIDGLSNSSSPAVSSLGKNFLAEFGGADLKLDSYHTHDGKSYSLLIRPPMVLDDGAKKRITIAVMETKSFNPSGEKHLKPRAQIIECWWPDSVNSTNIKAGVGVLPDAWSKENIKLSGAVSGGKIESAFRPKGVKPDDKHELGKGEFFYYGQIHTYQIALIHEMIHAYHGIKGTSRSGTGGDVAAEEKMVVGLFGHQDQKYTENKFRALLGMQPRKDYKSLNVTDGMNANQRITWTKAFEGWCSRK